MDHFRTAIALDPEFALAWSGLADAIDALVWRDIETSYLLQEGRLAALRALTLDPEMAEGWVSAGILAAEFDNDHDLGELALRRALELRPSYVNANQQLSGLLTNVGRLSEARPYIEKAVELDPRSGFIRLNYGDNLVVTGEMDRARKQYELTEELIGGGRGILNLLGYARQLGLSPAEAADAGERMARSLGIEDLVAWRAVGKAIASGIGTDEAVATVKGSQGLTQRDQMLLRLGLGEREQAIVYLQEMRVSGAGDLWRIGVFPEWDPLRDDPRFIDMVKELGIPNGFDRVRQTAIWP